MCVHALVHGLSTECAQSQLTVLANAALGAGVTIVDSLSTLHLMGLHDDFEQ